jgi:hypothetical protein
MTVPADALPVLLLGVPLAVLAALEGLWSP